MDNNINISIKKNIKILHIADLHQRHFGRLYYSSIKKINNGLIKNNYNVLQISDRDLLRGNIFNLKIHSFLNHIYETVRNFKPDIILFGHVDSLSEENFYELKKKYKDIFFSQWFFDTLDPGFTNYEQHKNRFFKKYQICDTNFVTTDPEALEFLNTDKTFFIPNVCDSSIDILENYNFKNLEFDVFFALSHGQHRGVIKDDFVDERSEIINFIDVDQIKTNFFGIKHQPIWGDEFFNQLSKSKMGINLSRGKKVKYYSSDRICSLMANGLLTFLQSGYSFEDFFRNESEAIYFNSKEELKEKIIYYKKNDDLRCKIAQNGKLKYYNEFNNVITTKYIVNKILGINSQPLEKEWMK